MCCLVLFVTNNVKIVQMTMFTRLNIGIYIYHIIQGRYIWLQQHKYADNLCHLLQYMYLASLL